ncbi:GTPase HflX [Sporolactobacillus terrae]|uniref:GTPase HflX n=1 Tax=Sporolactobacillus terrae TaxID=269673 RepID=A0A410D8R1_9BACL|nr:GTPase HflX [Sporolactobacillus terrae]QAA22440.1 GTPase HflX [Sporolactobacillus terrae]QAA25414.1 GTPase HflX [Sporolactobacillus terrae]UAK17225.1 GTPase HflX [Sporolactobacillus terrae]BBN98758.1 GTPase HflX [Sporolactobacillus terrae]
MEYVILAACQLPHQSDEHFQSSLDELEALAKTAGGEVVAVVTQKRAKIDAATYIGSGKVQEIAALEKQLEANAVIFNSELSPAQQGRLGALLSAKVLDRTQLILDIFAVRARSREGKLQVELAQLKYLLPRLSGIGQSLSRLGGGIGTRGPGETKLESDRRYIRSRMKDISHQLNAVVSHRQRYRERRLLNNQCQIVLVGYTNAGKSTLFNQLTEMQTYAENKLFATLDPLTRKMNLPNGFTCLLSDTVGFIQQLPTQLIAAFRSTLEEVTGAQLIVHVLDASNPDVIEHEKTVCKLLQELEVDDLPMLTIYNKKDLLQTPFIVPKGALLVSAHDINDRKRILEAIESQIMQQMVPFHTKLLASEGKLLSSIKRNAILQNQTFDQKTQMYEVEGFVYPETSIASKLIQHQGSADKE